MRDKKKKPQIIRRFLPYLFPYKKQILLSIFCGLIGGTGTIIMTYYTGKAMDQLIGKGQVNFPTLHSILLLLMGWLVSLTLSLWFVQRLGNYIAYQSVGTLRKTLNDHLEQLPLAYYDQTAH